MVDQLNEFTESYVFKANGHEAVSAIHPTTIELTKSKGLTMKGDCIIGVNADFDSKEILSFLHGCKRFKLTIQIRSLSESFIASFNPSFSSDKEIVLRRSDFVSDRTLGINCDKACIDLPRGFVELAKDPATMINMIIERIE